jgi:SAM-dependent methyltransferase
MRGSEPNAYSYRWFELFHIGIPETRTIREIDFICACAPLHDFRKVIDVCCGMGRHARALSNRGYSVIGVDRDALAIAKARAWAGGPSYIQADVRDYQPDVGAYDVAILMSQSFGYFDAEANRDLLRRLASGLRQSGRIILDLWSPQFFATHQGKRDFELPDGIVHEKKYMNDGRLSVHLDYPDGGIDDFEWQLFTTSEMVSLAVSVDMALIVSCTDFDMATEPSSAEPRVQFVLERHYA